MIASRRGRTSGPILRATAASPSTRTAFSGTTRNWTYRRECFFTSPRLRGEVGAQRRVRGTIRESEPVESPPHPPPLPPRGARGHTADGDTSGPLWILPIPSVDRGHRQLCQFDAVDAADVERHHGCAVGLAAVCEDLHAAVDAGLMLDRVLVEQIFLQIVLAGAQHKAVRREEGEVQALLGADRTVARGYHREIAGAFEAHHAAMAAAGVGLAVRHRSAPLSHQTPGSRR